MRKKVRDVILISVDSLRFDAVGYEADRRYLNRYGLGKLPETPTLDRLAAGGFTFHQCRSASSITPPSHATLLSGRFPPGTGVRHFFFNRLRRDCPSLFELFRNEGFATLAAVDLLDVFRIADLVRGSERLFSYDDEAAIRCFEQNRRIGRRSFLFFHHLDAHFPYGVDREASTAAEHRRAAVSQNELKARADREGRQTQALLPLYLQGVRSYDQGRLRRLIRRLERAGLLEDTLLVITADHGEAMVDEPMAPGYLRFGHGARLSEELVRVPLLFSCPGNVRKGSSDVYVSSADVAPTLLAAAAVDPGKLRFDGIDRWPLVAGVSAGKSRATRPSPCYSEIWQEDLKAVFSDPAAQSMLEFLCEADPSPSTRRAWRSVATRFPAPRLFQSSVRQGALKLLRTWRAGSPGDALYDTERDAWERVDLLLTGKTASRLARRLSEAARGIRGTSRPQSGSPSSPVAKPASSRLVRQLRALGYLG